MPTIEFDGKNTEEAIEKACNQLHIAPDELKFEILTTGSSGIFGLGGKKARIKVVVEEKLSPKMQEEDDAEPRFERPAQPEIRERQERPRRQENRPRQGQRREEGQVRSDGERDERKRREPRREKPRREEERAGVPLPPTVAGPGESLYDGPEDEVMTKSRETLAKILQHMGIEATVAVNRIQNRVILNVVGDNSGLLIGKKGVTLDALQFLVNKIINREQEDKFRVIVDSESYRERRHQSLVDLANRMAEKAQRNHRPVTISQLSAHDRRVVHLALQEHTGLKTRSRGDGPLKNIVIIPGNRKGSSSTREQPRDRKEEITMDEPEAMPVAATADIPNDAG